MWLIKNEKGGRTEGETRDGWWAIGSKLREVTNGIPNRINLLLSEYIDFFNVGLLHSSLFQVSADRN